MTLAKCTPFNTRPSGTIRLPSTISGPYPHIREQRPADYKKAKADLNSYRAMSFFDDEYRRIMTGVSNTTLKYDNGQVVLEFKDPKALSVLISDAVVEKVSGEITDQVKDHFKQRIMSKSAIRTLDRFNLVLSSLQSLYQIYKDIDNKDLVMKQKTSRRKEARKRKIWFSITALVAGKAGTTKGADFQSRCVRVWQTHQKYERRLNAKYKWDHLERKLKNPLESRVQIHPR